MRAMLARFCLSATLLLLGRAGFCADDGLSAAVLSKVKAATVFLRIKTPRGEMQGSGFFIAKDLIVTNAHVVGMSEEDDVRVAPTGITAILNSGMGKNTASTFLQIRRRGHARGSRFYPYRDAESHGFARAFGTVGRQGSSRDHAGLHFRIPIRRPFGGRVWKSPRGMTIGQGNVSSIRCDEQGVCSAIQVNGNLNPGNSGGPIVDKTGAVLSVSVATIFGTQIGFSIPADSLLRDLNGNVLGFAVREVERDGGMYSAKVVASDFDPLKKVSAITFYWWTAVPGSARPNDPVRKTPTHGGVWKERPEALKSCLAYDSASGKWTGQFKDARVPDGQEIWGQAAFATAAARQSFTPAMNLADAQPIEGPRSRRPPIAPPGPKVPMASIVGPHWHLSIPVPGEYSCPAGHVYTEVTPAATFSDPAASIHSMEFTFTDDLSWGRNYDCQGLLHTASKIDIEENFSGRCGCGQVGRETPGYKDVMAFFARYNFDTEAFATSTPGQGSFEIHERRQLTFDADKTLYARGFWGRGDSHPGPKASNIVILADITCAHMPGAVMLPAKGRIVSWIPSPAKEAVAQKLYRAASEKGPFAVVQKFSENKTSTFTDTAAAEGATFVYKIVAEAAGGTPGTESNSVTLTISSAPGAKEETPPPTPPAVSKKETPPSPPPAAAAKKKSPKDAPSADNSAQALIAGPIWHLTIPVPGEYKCPAGHVFTDVTPAATFSDPAATIHAMEFTFTDDMPGGRNYDCQGLLHTNSKIDTKGKGFSGRCGGGQVGRDTPGYKDVMTFFARYNFDTNAFATSTPGVRSFEIKERRPLVFEADRTLYARGWWGRGDGHPGPKASNIVILADIACAHMPGAVMLPAKERTLNWIPSPAKEATAQKLYRAASENGPFTVVKSFSENKTSTFVDSTAADAATYVLQKLWPKPPLRQLPGAESNLVTVPTPPK